MITLESSKNNQTLIINSALRVIDFSRSGCDEMKKDTNGNVAAIRYEFLLSVWITTRKTINLIGSR
ncbi:MAG: hypothetical protein KJN64_05810 [Ignavibacteria bacterium]|nr:hypothetical protein [Ignavibacteria bacterium]NNL20593.1 hypothetical protein [Ignavibacteriaceae bacterium]